MSGSKYVGTMTRGSVSETVSMRPSRSVMVTTTVLSAPYGMIA